MYKTVHIKRDITGTVLDVGGGGECVIGQIFGNKVTAIDNVREELDEAPDCCEKLLMDAAALSFADCSFDNITFFYSLMYMSKETQAKAISEAYRVLKHGGTIYIWDTDIVSAYPDAFIVDLNIVSEKISIRTSYGIIKRDDQDSDSVLRMIGALEKTEPLINKNENHFFITAKKS